jgi:hypothetical protein
MLSLLFLSLLLASVSHATIPQRQPPRYFTQTLDHFNAYPGCAASGANPCCVSLCTLAEHCAACVRACVRACGGSADAASSTWQQRYYLDTSAWSGAQSLGPLLFIPGGEWSVTPSKGLLYGMVRELAVEMGGMAMIVEHRYYGGSIPFGNSTDQAFRAEPQRLVRAMSRSLVRRSHGDWAVVLTPSAGWVRAPCAGPALCGAVDGRLRRADPARANRARLPRVPRDCLRRLLLRQTLGVPPPQIPHARRYRARRLRPHQAGLSGAGRSAEVCAQRQQKPVCSVGAWSCLLTTGAAAAGHPQVLPDRDRGGREDRARL